MFEYCCRVCLETDLNDTFIDLFKREDESEPAITDQLKYCCGIKVRFKKTRLLVALFNNYLLESSQFKAMDCPN